ncbi:cyclohexanone monooxygenase [Lentinula aff. detonsa]|nr:cyclohexanone monooxygenase [Lentinula aff. detonsa]
MVEPQVYDVIIGLEQRYSKQAMAWPELGIGTDIQARAFALILSLTEPASSGARVDSEMPVYQFSDPELWRDWTFTEYYPGWQEIQAYFRYVDKKRMCCTTLGLFLRIGTTRLIDGLLPRRMDGLDTFKGQVYHTARWPEKYDIKGKKVGVIGNGASGVQVIQEIAPTVSHLTVFQRTPNMALPMKQRKINGAEEEKVKRDLYPLLYARRSQTFAGFFYDFKQTPIADTTPEERVLVLEDLWEKGGLCCWLGCYAELLSNREFNDEVYAFWRKKVRERITDPTLQEKLAPMKPPHPFGIRRPSLEQRYFEVFSQPNVTLVDINETAIEEIIIPKGLKTSNGIEHELDVLVLATGFDMVTGGITSIDIRGQDGISIKEKWVDGVQSYLGLASATYPNMFWIYGPQSPSSFSNGPSSIELISDWIIKCMKYMKENNISSIVPTDDAQRAYSDHVDRLGASSGLWFESKTSWYLGSNIEGKKVQLLNFAGGIPAYAKLCHDSAANGYDGFNLKPSLG